MIHANYFKSNGQCLCPECREAKKKILNSKSIFFKVNRKETMKPKSKRGFAGMSVSKRKAIASRGGKVSSGNFKNNPERARACGRVGGRK